MHIIKTHPQATDREDTFLVYWSNSEARPGGVLKVRVAPEMEDRHIAAELSAMQYLLEDKGVAGRHVVGNANTRLVFSFGAIRKLQRRQSDKAHLAPYASFLTTRFAGCPVSIDKDTQWFAGFEAEPEELTILEPRLESVRMANVGEVCITRHAQERLAERLLEQAEQPSDPHQAWKHLCRVVSDPTIREIPLTGVWAAVKYVHEGRQPGRRYLSSRYKLILVVTDNPGEGKRLVTTYPANRPMPVMARAA